MVILSTSTFQSGMTFENCEMERWTYLGQRKFSVLNWFWLVVALVLTVVLITYCWSAADYVCAEHFWKIIENSLYLLEGNECSCTNQGRTQGIAQARLAQNWFSSSSIRASFTFFLKLGLSSPRPGKTSGVLALETRLKGGWALYLRRILCISHLC